MTETLIDDLNEARPVLQDFIADDRPVAGIILGSGLNPFADCLQDSRFLPFGKLPHMKTSTAVGHVGRFVLGIVPGTDASVLCMQGRLHKYEGNTAQQVAFPVWLMAQCGIDTLITTNAAGAINPTFHVGDFCVMTDQINFTGTNPLVGVDADKLSQRFVPMLNAFDPELAAMALEMGQQLDVPMQQGVYLGLLGPSFETPAEIRMFASWGADTVAMSVVEEVIAARHMGMRVLGMSLISNMACGVAGADPNSDEVMDVAQDRERDFTRLMCAIIAHLR
ncbi:MAG: purine-nucleoside phosphorylase [Eggerthellaceae bacterium]|jgi:purine-nucleoside phosphorylase